MDRKIPYLDEHASFRFPSVDGASPEGIVAVGGNLSPGMLLSAYRQGIFPWYSDGEPILWWSPDPRFVLFPAELHVPRSLARTIRRGIYRVAFDTRFEEVIRACAGAPRAGQSGTWIVPEIISAYVELHRLGYAHSAEAFDGERLAGGLYGVSLGSLFMGESMFSSAPDASKVAFVALAERLKAAGLSLIDCQVRTDHLERFGAREIGRREYLAHLRRGLSAGMAPGRWIS